jgi:crossover junction endodeoxyribonuclease RuvC
LLDIKDMPKYLDATDGLAAAVCHHFQGGIGENNKSKSGSWTAFMSDNPKRVKKS